MTSHPKDPIIEPERARDYIAAARPDLAPVRLRHFGRGWDHEVFLVNEEWVYRFPRNVGVSEALDRELRCLPWLAPRLPVPVPVPAQHHRFGPGPLERMVGHRVIPGQTVCDAELDARARARLAEPLARFVRTLHALSVSEAPVGLPGDELGRLDVARRLPVTRAHLERLRQEGGLPVEVATAALELLERCPPRPSADVPVLVHADLHSRNILVHLAGALTGVIDWMDLHVGERAVDLACAFEVLPPEPRERFFEAYGPVAPETRWRARWRALDHAIRALMGSLERGDTVFARVCQRVLAESIR